MKVKFNGELGKLIFSEDNHDIPGLISILKETKRITIGVLKYEVKDIDLHYFMICPNENERSMVSELRITLKEIR